MTVVAAVPVKSALVSKVNWIATATMVVGVLNESTDLLQQVAPFVPVKYQHWVTVGVIVLGGIATIITRTFFTTSLTPSSAAKV